MVYKLHAQLEFATSPSRTTAETTINAALRSGFTVTRATLHGNLGLIIAGQSNSAIDAQAVYASVAGVTAVPSRSFARWHACYHGDLVQACATTGSKVW